MARIHHIHHIYDNPENGQTIVDLDRIAAVETFREFTDTGRRRKCYEIKIHLVGGQTIAEREVDKSDVERLVAGWYTSHLNAVLDRVAPEA